MSMDYLQITGGSIIRSSDCESLLGGVHSSFNNPGELKEKLSAGDWKNGNWSYFRRFSPDAQVFTLAVALALRDGGIKFLPELTVGVLAVLEDAATLTDPLTVMAAIPAAVDRTTP